MPEMNGCSRRAFLGAASLSWMAFAQSLAGRVQSAHAQTADAATAFDPGRPLALRKPPYRQRAKRVVLLFQNGGPSPMDLFDHKPELTRLHGQPYPGEVEAHFHTQVRNLLASPFEFRPRGDCGMHLSEVLPHLGQVADDITLIRSAFTFSVDHEQSLRLIHGGSAIVPRPAWGSWAIHGLGTPRDDLPPFVVLTDPGGLPIDGTKNWSAGFLPAVYQGTEFRSQGSPVFHLQTPADLSAAARENQLHLLDSLNAEFSRPRASNTELQARASNFRLATRMQASAQSVLDLSSETAETLQLYGLDRAETEDYGRRCLLARRLLEAGVPFVSVYLSGQPWDTHSNNAESLKSMCGKTDQPSAALVQDLKRRGLLDDTLVIWTGEFGRLPVSQGDNGRDHNRHAFSLWISGGGFKRGHVHGATDDFGYKAVEDVVSVHDLHATLLYCLGLDHDTLSWHHEGRDLTLTDSVVTGANILPGLLA